MFEPTLCTHFILFAIVALTSIILSQKKDHSLWKPITIVLLIGVVSKILTKYNNRELFMLVNMGLLGYIAGVFFIDDENTIGSILTFITLYFNFFNITKANFSIKDILSQRELNNILVTRTMCFLVVLGFTLLGSDKNELILMESGFN